MKKTIFLSLCAISVLHGSEVSTSEAIKGLYFGNLDNSAGARNSKIELITDYYQLYGRDNAVIGCFHGRGTSDLANYNDCTQLMQVYKYRDGSGNPNADNANFRDNVWCIESDNSNLGNGIKPSADSFVKYINITKNNVNLYASSSNVNPRYDYDTTIYQYSLGNYQESYKDFGVNTTGRLLVIAKNQNEYNPFSFYISDNLNLNNLSKDFTAFANNYIGIQNNKMRYSNDTKRRDMYVAWNFLVGESLIGDLSGRGSWCNEVDPYNKEKFKNNKGCEKSYKWEDLNDHTRYVRFFNYLKDLGLNVRLSQYGDHFTTAYAGEWGGVKNENGKIIYYGVSESTKPDSQFNQDDRVIKEYEKDRNIWANYKYDVYYRNKKDIKFGEALTVKNLATYGPNEFNNASSAFEFFNSGMSDKTYYGGKFGSVNKIGKCYFVNLQYYASRNSNNYQKFMAMDANKFLWNSPNNIFLQNYIKKIDEEYAIANYSIDRKSGVYTSSVSGEKHSFTLNTRPTSFRGKDEKQYGNSSNGKIGARYYLHFYPDADGAKTTEIDKNLVPRKAKVENLPSSFNDKEFYVVTELKYGVNNNAQLSFTYEGVDLDFNRLGFENKQECDISSGKNCSNMKFKFKDFKYKTYKLSKTDGGFRVISEDSEKNGYFSSEYTTDVMALRVDEGLLDAIKYKSGESILLELTLDRGFYADDRPFFETNSNTIINAKSSGKFYVIISDINFNASNVDFGSIWNKQDPDKMPVLNSTSTGFNPTTANTRIAGKPVYLGIQSAKSSNKLNNIDNFVTFDVIDANTNKIIKSADLTYYDNGTSKVNISHENDYLVGNPIFTQTGFSGAYPFYNGVVRIDDLKVGRYKVCYTIYSKSQVQEEINKNNNNKDAKSLIEVPVKARNCTNDFSLRPALVEYTTSTTFTAGENALAGGKVAVFNAGLKDADDKLIVTNEEFALTKTTLSVEDSQGKNYDFSLNATNKNTISDSNEVAFVKDNNNTYKINDAVVNFPLSTDAKLKLYEGKFTKPDSIKGLCNANAVNNKVDEYGKVGCLIDSKSAISINFASTKEYVLRTPIINNAFTDEKTFFKSEVGDNNSLKIYYVFNNLGAKDTNSLNYVYHKFSKDHNLEYELNFDNTDKQAKDRYLVNIDENYTDKSFNTTINGANQILVDRVIITKDKLNKDFDKKLEDLYNDTKTNNINAVIAGFAAPKDKISVDLELAYTKYKKTPDNKTIDTNASLAKPSVAEFSLLKSSKVSLDGASTNLANEYSFIFTNVTYKDNKVTNTDKITLNPTTDLELYYLNKKNERTKIPLKSSLYYKDAGAIINELSFNAEYGSSFSKNPKTGEVTITLTPDNAKKQYIKEVINLNNTSDLHGGKFSLEFTNAK
ncbi:hypothetical protein AVBRAN12654_00090 [Campylobacter sp. RM12654]|uniref:hypothetical protein n=1 Tax=Campylobacter sp. RM12654 TaxID=2735738 RepID=UPI0030149EFE|nr:hypothetical protein [Campylobacter sp. RM12654]